MLIEIPCLKNGSGKILMIKKLKEGGTSMELKLVYQKL